MPAKNERLTNPANCATAWFAVLESAKLRHDYETAGKAIQQLRRLGVKVQFTKPEAVTT